jgi:hypothetical protein
MRNQRKFTVVKLEENIGELTPSQNPNAYTATVTEVSVRVTGR